MKITALECIDFYKADHRRQYPEGTEFVYSNFTPRSSRLYSGNSNTIVFFGLQGFIKWFLKDLWNETFFLRDKEEVLNEYRQLMDHSLGKDAIPIEHIEELWELGYLPLEIKALPEGSRVGMKVPVLTVRNTHEKFFWLVNYLESVLSAELWKSCTNATIADEYKQIFTKYAVETGAPLDFVPFQGHDFSFRGMSGVHDAASSGAAHLTSFVGTDAVPSIRYAANYYNADMSKELIGCSVPASEHSVMCMGTKDSEIETFKRFITELYPTGIVSIVSDTWDFWKVITEYAVDLKEDILNRTPNEMGIAKTVFRPDCYDDKTQILTDTGWMYFKDLNEDTKVAQVDDFGEYSFVVPEKIIEQYYEGYMYHFKDHHGKVDLLVTPNHRMILTQNSKEKVITAENLSDKGYYGQSMTRSAKAKTSTKGITPLERIKVAFQADGSYVTGSTSSIRFHLVKERKINRLKMLLKDAGLHYSVYNISSGGVEFSIKVDSTNFLKDFSWVDTSNLCGKWCEDFVDELKYWDSSVRSKDRFKFDTTNVLVANVVELISVAAGKGVFVSKTRDNRKDVFSDVYTLHIMERNTVGGQSWTKTKENYKGNVYCVKVPTGKLLVKRNKCTMVCGNSGNPVDILCGTYGIKIEEFDSKDLIESVGDFFNSIEDYVEDFFSEEIIEEYSEDCGVGMSCDDNTFRLFRLDGKLFKANFDIEIGSSKQDRGDRLYFIENVKIASIEEYSLTSEQKGAVECLWDIFGGTTTDEGYKVLNERVGLIYGDSITLERAEAILKRLKDKGFASCNVVFGIGSYTYQYNTRDTFGFAMKATHGVVNGEDREIFKDPVTDLGTKKSAKGLLRVEKVYNKFVLFDQQSWQQEDQGELKTVFLDGDLVNETSLSKIRERLANQL